MAKWGCHLPPSGPDDGRQRPRYRAIHPARSAGYAAALLDPIYNRIREIGRTRTKIHTDDTRLPILAPSNGKTHKGALWVYVADDRNSGSQEPPIAWYRATMGRAGESVMSELAGPAHSRPTVSAATIRSISAAPFGKPPAWPICVARYSTFTTASRSSSARRRWPVSRRSTGSRKGYGGSRPPSDWPHDEGGPDHWSARCDDSSRAKARVCRAMPISPRPSPMAPSDGERSTASSTMANSSPTTSSRSAPFADLRSAGATGFSRAASPRPSGQRSCSASLRPQALRRRCRSLRGQCHRAHPERLGSLALGRADAVELGTLPSDAAPVGSMSAIDDMALSDEALEAWMASRPTPARWCEPCRRWMAS